MRVRPSHCFLNHGKFSPLPLSFRSNLNRRRISGKVSLGSHFTRVSAIRKAPTHDDDAVLC